MPSLYAVSIPPFIRGLSNLSKHLAKASAWAGEAGVDEADLVNARLIADMLPLAGQVQRASDTSRFVAVRVGGIEPRPMADTETSFDDLQARIAATIAYLEAVPATAFDGREGSEVVLKFGQREVRFTGESYVQLFAIPNFYFHATTAYAILRHKGVPLGKVDFIGAP